MAIRERHGIRSNGNILDTAVLNPVTFTEPYQPENQLVKEIEERIKKEGPITFNGFMEPWLDAYYSQVVIGDEDGRIPAETVDFLTPPEYTPILGLSVARQIIQLWESMSMPEGFRVVEMGAGNGTLAHDILHGFRYLQKQNQYEKDPSRSIKYTIVEKNPELFAKQRNRLAGFFGQVDLIHTSATAMPLNDITGVFISSELPDAFPVHLVKKNGEDWKELFVDLGNDSEFEKKWDEPVPEVGKFIEEHKPIVEEGKVYPVNIDATRWMGQVGKALKSGYVITIDYDYGPKNKENIAIMAAGRERLVGIDAINRCFSKTDFGLTDITTEVDFQVLADIGKVHGLNPLGYVSLAGFLYGLCFDQDLKGVSKHFPDNIIGDRIHNFNQSMRLYEYDAPHWKVLVQSKGIDNKCDISGIQYLFNDDRDSGTSITERLKFRSIKM